MSISDILYLVKLDILYLVKLGTLIQLTYLDISISDILYLVKLDTLIQLTYLVAAGYKRLELCHK